MSTAEVTLRFNDVSFGYGPLKPIFHEASFSVRRGGKITLMGQNGAGKSTLFKLITNELHPDEGTITIPPEMTIATALQVIPRDQMELTIEEYFAQAFSKKVYDLEPKIKKVLEAVNLDLPLTKKLGTCSGGQQARLLLAFALIQDPDLLLLDEPTNNLDKEGIAHLRTFLKEYKKTLIVISHDAHFLNSFTEGVLYLDSFTRKIEQYTGNYFAVMNEIGARLDRERMKNVRLQKDIQHRKEQQNFFAQKGGHLRDVARKMREKIEELEEDKVDMRREDKTIREFEIPVQEDIGGIILSLNSVSLMHGSKTTKKSVKIELRKKEHLLLSGPNGVGKTTLLESIANGKTGVIAPGVRVGYYRQDFSTLDFDETVYMSLARIAETDSSLNEEKLRSIAAGFLMSSEVMKTKIGALSEGQKGLLMFAHLILQKPGLLILDEPTNHINFRHIPIIATALDAYQGAMVLVSHVPEFVKEIRIDQELDLGTLSTK